MARHSPVTMSCIEAGPETENDVTNRTNFDFIIHVHATTGKLTFTKTLDGLNKGDTEARFTIKIEEVSSGKVYYKTLTFNGSGSEDFTMELPTGDYRITELKTGGYTNGTITDGNAPGDVWELTADGLSLSVENKKSGTNYPQGGDTAVNTFTFSNGEWTWDSDHRKNKDNAA